MNVGKQHSNSFPRSKRPSITKETNEVLKGERLLDNLARLSKNEINKRDIFGRSLAHLAASSGRTDLMSAVCENLHVDLMAADYENGWTPMHVALAAGNLGCAQILLSHCPEVIKSKDRDHSSPMEIINSMLQVKVEHWDRDDSDKGTNHLFMFGSNANHNLGFADSDNRSNPEMAKIKRNVEHTVPRFRFHPINIRDVQLSKLHSAIITGDLKDNLMVCGIPRGGRLGLNSTAFTFTHVPGFRKERVISVALGLDHTVAVTESGGCYTWGSNHYCQLGYNLSENNITTNNNNNGSLNMMGSSNSNNIQPTPRKLGGDLKKLNIIGCSASNIHTVVFTSFEMFSWGKNNGQLGFPTDKEFESVPRKVLHLSHSVTMVKATDIATIVLLENGDVWVFMNGGRFKVQFPSERRNDTFDIFTPRIPPSSIVKIAASLGGQVCALDSNGSIFGFNLSPFYKRNNAELSTRNIMRNLKVTKLWFGRKAHLRARDVDIGDDGSIMLCTESGSVWRLSGKKKFRRVPLINRIQQVRCDSSFSSFAAVREELKLSPIGISSISLGDDFHFLVPFVDNDNNRKVDELMRQQSEKEDNKIAYSFFSLEHNPLDDTSAVNSKAASDRCQHIVRWLSSCSDDSAVKMGISSSDDSSNTCHDMFFSTQGVRLGVHKCFIYCRVPVLATMSINDCLYVNNSRKLYIEKNLLVFEGFQLTTLVIFVYYLYTDNLLAVWDAPVKTSPKHINVSKEELIELGRVLKLTDLCVAIQRHCQPYHNISDDSMKLKNQQSTADIVIHLKDDELYYCHSFILCSRSALFSNMLAARWGRLKDANRLIEVDLQNIDLETFEIVIHHLYGDRIFDLFDCVKGESSKAFINFVLKVLYAADYLLLPKLSEICQSILLNFGE